MRRFPFVHVDVFAERSLAGNGLTVFTDARGLSDAEMQSLARETRQAETTFVLREPGADLARTRVRIFTAAQEMPFAGHPTLGTAAVLRGTSTREELVLELNVGPIAVRFERPGFPELRAREPELGEVVPPRELAMAIGMDATELDPHLPAQLCSVGLPFIIAPLRNRAVLRKLHASVGQRLQPLLQRLDAHGVYFVCRGEEPGVALHARMIDPFAEDPATGSAGAACAAWMVANGVVAPDVRAVISQGEEIQRPSRLYVRASKHGERVTDVRVAGNVIEVARGEVTLP